jgi:hypothetical protein
MTTTTNPPEEIKQWARTISKMFPPGVNWVIAIAPQDPEMALTPLVLSNLTSHAEVQALLTVSADRSRAEAIEI